MNKKRKNVIKNCTFIDEGPKPELVEAVKVLAKAAEQNALALRDAAQLLHRNAPLLQIGGTER